MLIRQPLLLETVESTASPQLSREGVFVSKVWMRVAHTYNEKQKIEKSPVLLPESVVLDSQKLRSKFEQN